MKSYRLKWGDVDIGDMPIAADSIEKAKQEACDALLASFNNVRHSSKKPHTAQLIDHAGKVVAQFDIRQVVGVGPKPVDVPCRPPGE